MSIITKNLHYFKNTSYGVIAFSVSLILSLALLIMTTFQGKASAATINVSAEPIPSNTSLNIPYFGTDLASLFGVSVTPGSNQVNSIASQYVVYGWDIDPSAYSPCSGATLVSLNASTTIGWDNADLDLSNHADAVFVVGSGGLATLPTTLISGDYLDDDPNAEFLMRGEYSLTPVPLPGGINGIYTTGITSGLITINLGFDAENITFGTATSPTITLSYDDSTCITNHPPATDPDLSTSQAGEIGYGNALNNDSDPNGDIITITSIEIYSTDSYPGGTYSIPPSGSTGVIAIPGVGTLEVFFDGQYSFQSDPDFNGNYPGITYTVSDGHNNSSKGAIIIQISAKAATATLVASPTKNELAKTGISYNQKALAISCTIIIFLGLLFVNRSNYYNKVITR